ncbi:transposase [Bifidobacterium ramosum]|uniref:Transposase n=1 Tax=Bifidobacterium ramosum TaxID=1798158 RepID=A0A6L4X015_9BIFI|nr:transposase [Bifidobacterium ramosum]
MLVAIGVGADGRRRRLVVAEGMKEDAESWRGFVTGIIERCLRGVRLVTGGRCAGLVAAVGELPPGARATGGA